LPGSISSGGKLRIYKLKQPPWNNEHGTLFEVPVSEILYYFENNKFKYVKISYYIQDFSNLLLMKLEERYGKAEKIFINNKKLDGQHPIWRWFLPKTFIYFDPSERLLHIGQRN
jgi:hypothetical protein